jgi:hypothetical protein
MFWYALVAAMFWYALGDDVPRQGFVVCAAQPKETAGVCCLGSSIHAGLYHKSQKVFGFCGSNRVCCIASRCLLHGEAMQRTPPSQVNEEDEHLHRR